MTKTARYFLVAIVVFLSAVSAVHGQVSEPSFTVPAGEDVYALTGDWEFYRNQLLTPEEISRSHPAAQSIRVPGSWRNAAVDGRRLPSAFGYGTYRTVVGIPREDVGRERAVALSNIGSAYRIWIDGKLYPGIGKVGMRAADETPLLQVQLVAFRPESPAVELVIQVSNFSFREGGIIHAIRYGDSELLRRSITQDTYSALFLMGAALVVGLYHLTMAMIRKQDKALALIGLICMAYGTRTFAMTEHVALFFFPSLSWRDMVRMEYAAEGLAFMLLAVLVRRMFPQEAPRLLVGFIVLLNTALIAVVFGTPPSFFTRLLPYHPFITLGILLYLLLHVGVMAKRRRRDGAVWNIAGISLIVIAGVNDTLNFLLALHTFYMMSYCGFVFILIQGLIAAKRYERLHADNRLLSSELQEMNRSLLRKVEDRTQELRDQKRQLELAQETRTRLLANVAHDIGTPIAGMQTYLQMLQDGRLRGEEAKVYARVSEKLSSIQRLNQDLLELSKLEAQKLPFYMEELAIRAWFEAVCESLQAEYRLKGVSVEIGERPTMYRGGEVYVDADRHRLGQVIHNLVGNAAKFGPAENARVILHCTVREETGNLKAFIAVEDFGAGIAEADLPYIFQQFYRRSESHESSGIGLAIVKQIVDQHGGEAEVRNKPEGGCIFRVTLPARTA